MNTPHNHHSPSTHELLSAYFDRETTREEAAEIERLLERSPEARQMLDDFADLSDMLHDLPRHTLDANFANRVLERTQPVSIAATLIPPAASHRSALWKWRVGLGLAATAAAASVIVMLSLPHGRNEGQQAVVRNSLPHVGDFGLAPAAPDALDHAATVSPASGFGARASEGIANGTTVAAKTHPLAESSKLSKDTASTVRLGGTSAAISQDAPTSGLSGISLPADVNLNEFSIGTVVEALQTRGDEVSLVKLTVVDVMKGLDRVQVLFTNNSIRVEDGKRQLAVKSEAGDKQRPGELLAIYVEAPRRQIEGFLEQLKQESNAVEPIVVGMRLEPAVDAVALNDLSPDIASQSRLGMQQQKRFAGVKEQVEVRRSQPAGKSAVPAPKEVVKADEAKKLTDPAPASRKGNVPPAPAAAPGTAKSIAANEAASNEARQYLLNLKPEALERSQTRSVANRSEQVTRNVAKPETEREKAPTTSASAPAGPPGDETMQVLFVFEPQSAPAFDKARSRKPTSSPPTKKS